MSVQSSEMTDLVPARAAALKHLTVWLQTGASGRYPSLVRTSSAGLKLRGTKLSGTPFRLTGWVAGNVALKSVQKEPSQMYPTSPMRIVASAVSGSGIHRGYPWPFGRSCSAYTAAARHIVSFRGEGRLRGRALQGRGRGRGGMTH